MKPKVSVLMPVYNGEKYLREAIDSILSQIFTDFEFVIVDDASTDRSVEIIKSYRDPRILFTRNDSNLGLIATLNRGLERASGEYVARMDQDDVSLPERLARQVAFMDSNPDIAASGTFAQDIDASGNSTSLRRVPFGDRLKYDFWRPSPLIHPSAIIRVAHLGNLRYDSNAIHAEDYDLWLRLRKNYKLENLPEYLLRYRVHGESISTMNSQSQCRSVYEILCRRSRLGISYDAFLILLSPSHELNPVRRALLKRRLANGLEQPYRGYLGEDVAYATDWLRARLNWEVVKRPIRQALYYLWRRIRPLRANDSLKR